MVGPFGLKAGSTWLHRRVLSMAASQDQKGGEEGGGDCFGAGYPVPPTYQCNKPSVTQNGFLASRYEEKGGEG